MEEVRVFSHTSFDTWRSTSEISKGNTSVQTLQQSFEKISMPSSSLSEMDYISIISLCSLIPVFNNIHRHFLLSPTKQSNLCPMVWALWDWTQRLCPYFTDTTHLREAKGVWGEGKALKIEAIKLRNCLAFMQKDDLYWLMEHKIIAKVTVCQPDVGVENNPVSARLHWS